MNRFLGGLTKSVRKPWHIYPIGVLFGLGFDTATEVGLLVLAGGAAAFNLPFYAILVLPILFAAGMCLMDTTDGVFMNYAYGWAFAKPVRKIFYNLTITSISVAVALIIGTIELVGVLADRLKIESGPLAAIANIPLDYAGYGIVALFVISWLTALAIWRFGKIENAGRKSSLPDLMAAASITPSSMGSRSDWRDTRTYAEVLMLKGFKAVWPPFRADHRRRYGTSGPTSTSSERSTAVWRRSTTSVRPSTTTRRS